MTLKTILRPGLNIALPSPSLATASDQHQACLNDRFWDLREVLRMAAMRAQTRPPRSVSAIGPFADRQVSSS
jgi:hypothetical protein